MGNVPLIDWRLHYRYDAACPSGLRKLKGNKPVGFVSRTKKRPRGYWHLKLSDGKTYQIHRIIYLLEVGPLLDTDVVDHYNRDTLDNTPSNFRLVSRAINSRNAVLSKNNKTGVNGVSYNPKDTVIAGKQYSNPQYAARWKNLDGTEGSKAFSIKKLGDAEAFRQACDFRAQKIEELNAQGAGYSEAHGT